MPPKGSRSAQFRMTNVRITGKGQNWHVQVLHEADLEDVSFDEAVEASKEMEKVKATVTVEPGRIVTDAAINEFPALGSSGNLLPFAPEGQPDTKAVIKRVRETKGGEK